FLFHEVVQLQEIELIHAKAFQGALNLQASPVVAAFPRLGGEKKAPAVLAHPRADPQLGGPVRGRRVDGVHTGFEQDREALVGLLVGGACQRGSAEEDTCAVMAGSSEGQGREHWPTSQGWGTACATLRRSLARRASVGRP